VTDWQSRTSAGRKFQTDGAATDEVQGTTSIGVAVSMLSLSLQPIVDVSRRRRGENLVSQKSHLVPDSLSQKQTTIERRICIDAVSTTAHDSDEVVLRPIMASIEKWLHKQLTPLLGRRSVSAAVAVYGAAGEASRSA